MGFHICIYNTCCSLSCAVQCCSRRRHFFAGHSRARLLFPFPAAHALLFVIISATCCIDCAITRLQAMPRWRGCVCVCACSLYTCLLGVRNTAAGECMNIRLFLVVVFLFVEAHEIGAVFRTLLQCSV